MSSVCPRTKNFEKGSKLISIVFSEYDIFPAQKRNLCRKNLIWVNLSLVNYLSIFNKFVLMQLKACIPEGVLNL